MRAKRIVRRIEFHRLLTNGEAHHIRRGFRRVPGLGAQRGCIGAYARARQSHQPFAVVLCAVRTFDERSRQVAVDGRQSRGDRVPPAGDLDGREAQSGEGACHGIHAHLGVQENVGLVHCDVFQPRMVRLRPLDEPIDALLRPCGFGIPQTGRMVDMDFESLPVQVRNEAPKNHIPYGMRPHLAADDDDPQAIRTCSAALRGVPAVGRGGARQVAVTSQQCTHVGISIG